MNKKNVPKILSRSINEIDNSYVLISEEIIWLLQKLEMYAICHIINFQKLAIADP